MITQIKTEKLYTVTLNQEEVDWLKGVMQNPLYAQTPLEESTEDNNMRRSFFHIDEG